MDKLNSILKEKIKAKIIEALMTTDLSFSLLLKKVNVRDNGQLNYHLKIMIREGLIIKNDGVYELTSLGKKMGVYINQFQLKEMYPIPVVCPIAKNEKEEILMVRRAKHPEKGTWGFPGGKIRIGETNLEAAQREFEEETGINLKAEKVLGYFPVSISENNKLLFHVNLVPILMKKMKGNEKISLKDEHNAYKFIGKKEIKNYKLTSINEQILNTINYESFVFREFSIKK